MADYDNIFDLLIVGGGVNGAGIACDAAGRGLDVLLCEQDDLASGTSSASSKLIHGGLRYLEHYEFRLVREALAEREVLLSKAPHIIWPLNFVLPLRHQIRPAWLIRLGLFVYDHLAAHPRLPGSRGINLRAHPVGEPLQETITNGFVYSDCWVDDARLVVLNAMSAARDGATILTRTRLKSARRVENLWEAQIEDTETDAESVVRARTLVNAAGPWVSEVLEGPLGADRTRPVRLVKGSHMVVPRLHPGNHAFILQNIDRRIVFVLPYEGKFSLIGTTDVPIEGKPGKVEMDPGEATYLCNVVNDYFTRPVSPTEAVWAYAGIRPLFDDDAQNPSAVTRDYKLGLNTGDGGAPLLTVYGGKITIYRRLAEQALAKLAPFLPHMGKEWTATAPLPGGDLPNEDFEAFAGRLAADFPAIDPRILRSLARRHGTLSDKVLGDAITTHDLGVAFGGGLCEREVNYLIGHEWARTAEDVLWRRTKCGLRMDEAERRKVADYIKGH